MTSHSKALWELATCAGTEHATTTYHTKYNKHRPAERPYALGFLTRGRFLRFAQTNEGYTLLQVNCSRPGAGGGGRENFIRSVCSEFFSLCVEKSKTNEVQEGDYADVGAARNMRSGACHWWNRDCARCNFELCMPLTNLKTVFKSKQRLLILPFFHVTAWRP